MTENSTVTNAALANLASVLVEEMDYINYPQEWSRTPLSDILPGFYTLLDYHPDKLGSLIKAAYKKTFPKAQTGNIGQLASYDERFAKGKVRSNNELLAMSMRHKKPANDASPLDRQLLELSRQIITAFSKLTPAQENEHRTLERVCFAMDPLFFVSSKSEYLWNVVTEYADMWRKLDSREREKLTKNLLEELSD